jgi:hypothetical protein
MAEPSERIQKLTARDGRRKNNLTHGMRATTMGGTPAGASYVGRLSRHLNRELEAAVEAHKGKLSLVDQCHINAAVKWERHGLLATRWLKLHAAEMTHDQRLNYSREIARAAESRNRSISALGLEDSASNIIDALYAASTTTSIDDER